MSRLDDLRAANPHLGFAIYAIEPDAGVTLEVFDNGDVFQFQAATEDAVLAAAFPLEAPPLPPPDLGVLG